MTYLPDPNRYHQMHYRRTGHSGLLLPEISLGLWHNFGESAEITDVRDMCCAAFDHGITHFDLANNYGPPPGSAEVNFGKVLTSDLHPYRDELVISSKAGYEMWPGPYGDWGSRKYLVASLEQSLSRLGLSYVDIYYSHRYDPNTPLEETMGALDALVRQGKTLYVGISNYPADKTVEAARILKRLNTPCLVHQPSYSMFNRWIEDDHLLDAAEQNNLGVVVYSPLAQGLLTNRYLNDIPVDSRAALSHFLPRENINETTLKQIHSLNAIAAERGQSLAQMALSWALRDSRVTSAIIGASQIGQIRDCAKASGQTSFSENELVAIDEACGLDRRLHKH